jgi:hypothetical protein
LVAGTGWREGDANAGRIEGESDDALGDDLLVTGDAINADDRAGEAPAATQPLGGLEMV